MRRPFPSPGRASVRSPRLPAVTYLFVPVGLLTGAGWHYSTAQGPQQVFVLLPAVIAAATVAVFIAARVLADAPLVGGAAVAVTCFGAGIQSRLEHRALGPGALIPIVAVLLGIGAGWGLATLMLRRHRHSRRTLALLIALVAFGLRLSSLVLGDPESGALVLGGMSLQLGELARVLMAAAPGRRALDVAKAFLPQLVAQLHRSPTDPCTEEVPS